MTSSFSNSVFTNDERRKKLARRSEANEEHDITMSYYNSRDVLDKMERGTSVVFPIEKRGLKNDEKKNDETPDFHFDSTRSLLRFIHFCLW